MILDILTDLEIILGLLTATFIYFFILVFHNKNPFSLVTFLSGLARIVCAFLFMAIIIWVLKPYLDSNWESGIIVGLLGALVFMVIYSKDYYDQDKREK
ncbi:hypothetical protein [Thalassotalea aquiviva]|uniref:hypothetical protein n=1 Tax=Thalassotalea aquiviva TaxID=3242415 RepID=UPI00352B41A1